MSLLFKFGASPLQLALEMFNFLVVLFQHSFLALNQGVVLLQLAVIHLLLFLDSATLLFSLLPFLPVKTDD